MWFDVYNIRYRNEGECCIFNIDVCKGKIYDIMFLSS